MNLVKVAREFAKLFKQTLEEWLDDRGFTRAASLSYYTVFSIAPLLLIAVVIAGLVFGRDAVSGQLQEQLQALVGESAAAAVQEMMKSAATRSSGILASIVGVTLVVVGATGAFVELQDTLNDMWGVDKNKTSGIIGFLRARVLSLAMVLVISFLLLVSLFISTALSALSTYSAHIFPGWQLVLQFVNLLFSFAVITFLFAMIYKFLPNTDVAWKNVWLGAGLTSAMFAVGKLLIGLYLGKSSVSSSYGAAGSFAVLLIWINYSSMILYFGAEFTQVLSRAREGLAPLTEAKQAGKATEAEAAPIPSTRDAKRPDR